ncbi:hypothetical protein WJX74_008624 [Apatococcus lobatus]|uniref:Cyclic nucleotide-binding domain-containing protein n=1 Tax=Apatococcus lobatus TaxID=904363 RepID=A0AAW1SG53_9CHLO
MKAQSFNVDQYNDPTSTLTLSTAERKGLAKEFFKRQREVHNSSTRDLLLLRPFEEGTEHIEVYQTNAEHNRFKAAADSLRRSAGVSANRPWYLIDPEGLPRRLWDFFAVILIYLLILYIPLLIAFFDETNCNYFTINHSRELPVLGADPGTGWQVFPVLTNSFFVADILVNFMTGTVDSNNRVHYQLITVWKEYLTSWFLLDLVACMPLECILANAAKTVNFYNTPKLIRLLRAVGIRRRCRGDPFRWVDAVSTKRREFSYSAKRLVTAALLMLVVVHYFACLLWWTVRLQGYPDITWPVQVGVVDAIVPVQWLWSIFNVVSAMIGLAYGPFPPRTWGEALVFIVAMVTVAVLFAIFNGFILAAILHSSSSRHRIKKRMDDVLEMTRLRNLPADMRTQILDYFMYKYREGQLEETDGLLRELPYDLQVRVAIQSTGSLLTAFPFFAKEEQLLKRVALLLRPMYALAGEELITQGWPNNQMFFLRNSTGYVDMVLKVDGKEQLIDTLTGGSCFGETALLPLPSSEELQQELQCQAEDISNYSDTFTATCTARALTNLDMFVLEAEDFHRLADHYPRVFKELKQIAIRHAGRVHAKSSKQGRPAFPVGSWGDPAHRIMKRSVTFPVRARSLSTAPDPFTPPQRLKTLPTIHDIFPQDDVPSAILDATSGSSADPLLQPPPDPPLQSPSRQQGGLPPAGPATPANAVKPVLDEPLMQRLASNVRDDTGTWGPMRGLQRPPNEANRQLPPRDLWDQLGGRSNPAAPLRHSGSGGDTGVGEWGFPSMSRRGPHSPGLGRLRSGLSGFGRRAFQDEMNQARANADEAGLEPYVSGSSHTGLTVHSNGRQASLDGRQVRQDSDAATESPTGGTAAGASGYSPRHLAPSSSVDRLSSPHQCEPGHSPKAPSGLGSAGSMRDERLIDPQPAAHIQLPIRNEKPDLNGSDDDIG